MKKIILSILLLLFSSGAFAAQHDNDIEDQVGYSFQKEINDFVDAVQSANSGATDPASNSIGGVVFTGSGLDDATSGGTFTGTADERYEILIDATGTPDTFKWRKVCKTVGSAVCSYTSGVSITGGAQTLSEGVTVTFAATTGHTLSDKWEILGHFGATESYQFWADTGNDLLKQRNAANSAWVSILTLSTGAPVIGGSGDDVQVDTAATTNPDFQDGGDINFTNSANVVTATVQNDKVTEAMLKAVDSAVDEECLTYETTTGDFEWQSCGAGGGDSVSVDSGAVVDPDFVSTGDIDFVNTTNTITANINAGTIIETDLDADVAPVDGDFFQYDSTGLNFTWRNAAEVLSDIGAQGVLTNEAGLYSALSDVTNFLQAGDALAGDDITDGSIDATEIATDSINLTELDDGADTPVAGEALFVATGATDVEYKFITESFCFAVSDETTAITTGTAKLTMRMPYAFTLTDVRASVNTVSSSGLPTFDINETATTILSTKLTIDASEKTSETAATAAVISDTALADDAEITFDIDTAGTGAKGAKICLIGHQ